VNEEQLIDLMREAGPVVSLAKMFDKDSGLFLGCAKCEYADKGTAELATRHLNGRAFHGRCLIVSLTSLITNWRDTPKMPVTREEYNALLMRIEALEKGKK
jgi:RNA recognition motif-containing protein